MALANIQTTSVGTTYDTLSPSLQLSGKIRVNENETFTQPAHFDGRIEKLYVKSVGEKVKMGQPIAEVYSPELIAAQQELITTYRNRKTQPELYNAVKTKFKNWMISGLALDKIAQTGNTRASFTIYAHVSGIVSTIEINQGAHIMDGKPIFTVANLTSVWAEFDAYENQLSQLKRGQLITVTTNTYPNTAFNATVNYIDPILNTGTRTAIVRATLDNNDAMLKPGMFIKGKIVLREEPPGDAINIPASAVLWTGERSVVYVKPNINEPIFEMREVILGDKNGDMYTILNGLSAGDEIVTNGTFTIDAAAQLQGKKSMMNRDPNIKNRDMTNMHMQIPMAFQQGFDKVLMNYLQMKDAFVADDPVKVSAFAKATLKELGEIPTADPVHDAMFQNHLDKVNTSLVKIVKSTIIKNQRDNFVELNENMIPLITAMSNKMELYIQKCPMANKGNGAFWISDQKEIKNPYYGKEMMDCGSVVDKIVKVSRL